MSDLVDSQARVTVVTVVYNGVQLQVIGVLAPLSSDEATSNNDLAIVPLSTYSQRLVGGTNRNSVSSIYVKATSAETLSAAYQETDQLLLNTHKITSASNAWWALECCGMPMHPLRETEP